MISSAWSVTGASGPSPSYFATRKRAYRALIALISAIHWSITQVAALAHEARAELEKQGGRHRRVTCVLPPPHIPSPTDDTRATFFRHWVFVSALRTWVPAIDSDLAATFLSHIRAPSLPNPREDVGTAWLTFFIWYLLRGGIVEPRQEAFRMSATL